MRIRFRFLAITAALSIAAMSSVAQALPVLEINWLNGETKVIAVGPGAVFRGYQLAAKTILGGASDVATSAGRSLANPTGGGDGIPDGEHYFQRIASADVPDFELEPDFSLYQPITPVSGFGSSVGDINGPLQDFGTGVLLPDGYVNGATSLSTSRTLPRTIGNLFKPMNPFLTPASASQNLLFKYLLPNDNTEYTGSVTLINYVPVPEPAGMALISAGLLGLLAARRRRDS